MRCIRILIYGISAVTLPFDFGRIAYNSLGRGETFDAFIVLVAGLLFVIECVKLCLEALFPELEKS